jgi:hypothetical protein
MPHRRAWWINAQLERLPILTTDPQFAAYDVVKIRA